MAGAAFLEGEAEPLTRAEDVPELSEGAQGSNRTPRWWAALGAALLAGAGAAVAVPRAGRPAAAPLGETLVKLEALPTKAELHVIYQDFKAKGSGGHPDFEPGFKAEGKWWEGSQTGLVKQNIGSDGLPAWNDCKANYTPCSLSTEENFKKWWIKTSLSKEVHDTFVLTEKKGEEGVWEYEKPDFFPLSGMGWDDESPKAKGELKDRNYYFTMQARKTFVYHTGEYFKFKGDDDLWVFFNGYLGLDIGGMHIPVEGEVYLDNIAAEAGITKGQTVALQIFFAERAYSESNFLIHTNIQLQEDACFEYDRVLLNPKTADSTADSMSWEGISVAGSESEGNQVSFQLVCTEGGFCDDDQPAGGTEPNEHFPVVSLAHGKSMPLNIAISEGFDQSALHITFYNLQDGMAIEAEGVHEFWTMKDSYIEYTRDGTLDVFSSSAPAGIEPPEYPDELTEAHKKMAVSFMFTDVDKAKITLKNEKGDDEVALFRFTLTPMFECVPCIPKCDGNEPFRAALTTTLAATITTVTTTTAEEEYECCVFDKIGVKFGCHEEKPWYIPWCPGEAKYPWSGWL